MHRAIFIVGFLAIWGCGDEPIASLHPDSGKKDAGFIDVGFWGDSGLHPDAQGQDATTDGSTDSSVADTASGVDGRVNDAEIGDAIADGGDASNGLDAESDSGVQIPDQDGDGISDADEGNGAVDSDNDGTPDTQDTDSDNDGIDDRDEAGDADPATTPIDSDNDGTPDFRDEDSDNDNIPDSIEGNGDPDNDNIPSFRDDDSDGDGILDSVEGIGDPDNDQIPNYLDDDADGDGILDSDEGTGDPDNDQVPNYLDDDSDGDSLNDAIELLADPDNDQVPAFLDDDSDGDGILDAVELDGDPDGDRTGNWLDEDADGDTIRDSDEGTSDPDNDNIPNYLDDDSDGDGVDDRDEAGDAQLVSPPRDSDFDSIPDYLDLDSDADTIRDAEEGLADSDNDGMPDMIDIDSDNDSVLDLQEAGDSDPATAAVDSDNDGAPDYRDTDSDNDTIADAYERSNDTDGDLTPDRLDDDSDGDGILDSVEAGDANLSTPPVDTDNDTVPDFRDADSDNDGLADRLEPGCPGGPDRLLADTDHDGFLDPAEIAYGSNPCDVADGIDDFYFVLPPLDPPQDAPLVFDDTDIDRADLAINVDTTGSMGGEINNLRTSLSGTIIPGVSAAIPQPAFAVSSFEDYPIEPFGSATTGDIPFRLGTRVTTDGTVAQTAVDGLTTRDGRDIPEDGIESLYQIATGAGTQWSTGSVPAFDPMQNRIAGVADGTIGGVGFRDDSLPIVVHVTDAPAHEQDQYVATDPQITAVTTQVAKNGLAGIGARVITIANQSLPRPDEEIATTNPLFTAICNQSSARFFGILDAPTATDTDWFQISATAGQTIYAETTAQRIGSTVDTMVAVYDSGGTMIGGNDDLDANTLDSALSIALAGPAPYFVAISAYADVDFNGSESQTRGFYFVDVTLDGAPYTPSPTECRAEDANSSAGATPLVDFATATAPANVSACVAACEALRAAAAEPFRLPYGMSEATGAIIPTCAWNEFGTARPTGCGVNQCCTGLAGVGVATNSAGQCPLSFLVDDQGTGLGDAVVSGIEALVNFSTFTITTITRPDPAELAASGLDTTCFIHGVVPISAAPPNSCAPTPTMVDLVPPPGQLDSFENVVPGTVLTFQVNAENRAGTGGTSCVDRQNDPQLFRAFIDVVADGVTVVDTRDVIIIIPPLPPQNGG